MNSKAISDLYYSPRTGFTSAHALWLKLKEQKVKVTLKEVQQWLAQQLVQQVTARRRPPTQYSTIVAPSKGAIYQMDLMVYDRFEYNHYRYILVVVDIYSRYAMATALTNRTLPTLMK